MAKNFPILGTVTVEPSSTSVYSSQTITPAAVAAGVITLTSADIGGDSGASLSLNEHYRLIVDGANYWDTFLDNTDADEHFFRITATYGAPSVSTDITEIIEVTPSVGDVTIDELTVASLNVDVVSVDEDWTVKNETVIFADASVADVELQLPLIADVGPGRLLIVNADVGANSVLVSPNAADQVAGGGADTDLDINTADAVYVLVSTTTDAINDWKVVLTV